MKILNSDFSKKKTNEMSVLSDEEKQLLNSVFVNKDRIFNGNLLDYQMIFLKKIRYAHSYLNEKYPDKKFYFVEIEPENKFNGNNYTYISFYELLDDQKMYDMRIYELDGKYSAEDNYYGELVKIEYDEAVRKILCQLPVKKCRVCTRFPFLYGKEIDGKMSAEKMFTLGEKLGRKTSIYIDDLINSEEESIQLTSKIKSLMAEHNLYGSYAVYIMNGLFRTNFNCF